jgi:hypothetical protein
MTQAATEVDYKSLEKKTVVFTVRNNDEEVVVEGIVEAASPVGIAFRAKGKSQLQLLNPGDIVRHEVLPEKPKTLKQKVMKPIETNKVRQHLADHHGINLPWLNSVSNEEAESFHNDIDHSNGEHGPLGHRHEEPKAEDESAGETELEKELAE